MSLSLWSADADAPVSETTERFMRAILASVAIDTIDELHLFAPLRQGTLETGLAVIAARVKPPVLSESFESSEPIQHTEPTERAEPTAQTELGIAEPEPELVPVLDDASTEPVPNPPAAVENDGAEPAAPADDPDSPYAPEPTTHPAPAARERHRVYTARYRYTVKGPDRGRWDVDVRDEADAPLITVETVVRGVQRRAGDVSDPVRYTNAQLRHALRFAAPAG